MIGDHEACMGLPGRVRLRLAQAHWPGKISVNLLSWLDLASMDRSECQIFTIKSYPHLHNIPSRCVLLCSPRLFSSLLVLILLSRYMNTSTEPHSLHGRLVLCCHCWTNGRARKMMSNDYLDSVGGRFRIIVPRLPSLTHSLLSCSWISNLLFIFVSSFWVPLSHSSDWWITVICLIFTIRPRFCTIFPAGCKVCSFPPFSSIMLFFPGLIVFTLTFTRWHVKQKCEFSLSPRTCNLERG